MCYYKDSPNVAKKTRGIIPRKGGFCVLDLGCNLKGYNFAYRLNSLRGVNAFIQKYLLGAEALIKNVLGIIPWNVHTKFRLPRVAGQPENKNTKIKSPPYAKRPATSLCPALSLYNEKVVGNYKAALRIHSGAVLCYE